MKKLVVILIIIFLFFSIPKKVSGISIFKVLKFIQKISSKIDSYSKELEHHSKEFKEYYNKYWKNINRKFFPGEFKLLKMPEECTDVYNKPYIDSDNKKEIWKGIFKSPKYIWEKYPYIKNFSHYTNNKFYKKDRQYRKLVDSIIKDEKEYLKAVENVIELLANTRNSQKIRGKKIEKMKKNNDSFGMPKAYWETKKAKLHTMGALLEFELQQQLVELLVLVNAETELNLKAKLLRINTKNRGKVEYKSQYTN